MSENNGIYRASSAPGLGQLFDDVRGAYLDIMKTRLNSFELFVWLFISSLPFIFIAVLLFLSLSDRGRSSIAEYDSHNIMRDVSDLSESIISALTISSDSLPIFSLFPSVILFAFPYVFRLVFGAFPCTAFVMRRILRDTNNLNMQVKVIAADFGVPPPKTEKSAPTSAAPPASTTEDSSLKELTKLEPSKEPVSEFITATREPTDPRSLMKQYAVEADKVAKMIYSRSNSFLFSGVVFALFGISFF
jgi:hypothetical protein